MHKMQFFVIMLLLLLVLTCTGNEAVTSQDEVSRLLAEMNLTGIVEDSAARLAPFIAEFDRLNRTITEQLDRFQQLEYSKSMAFKTVDDLLAQEEEINAKLRALTTLEGSLKRLNETWGHLTAVHANKPIDTLTFLFAIIDWCDSLVWHRAILAREHGTPLSANDVIGGCAFKTEVYVDLSYTMPDPSKPMPMFPTYVWWIGCFIALCTLAASWRSEAVCFFATFPVALHSGNPFARPVCRHDGCEYEWFDSEKQFTGFT